MDIVERARSIIINPGPTWAVIEQEPVSSPQQLYVPYMVILAAIPAVAAFIGMTLVGVGGFGFSFRMPIVTGVGLMITQYVLSLVMVFVWAWLVNALAGNFGGQANLLNALKLTVYGSTPGMVAGVFHLLPSLGILALVGSLYGLYVIYLGLPVLMKNPPEKSVPYMAVVVVVGIVCMVVIGAISAVFTPTPSMGRMMGSASDNGISISTPRGDVKVSATPTPGAQPGDAAVTIKTPDGEVKLDAKNMEEFAKRMEAMASAAAQAAEKSKTQ